MATNPTNASNGAISGTVSGVPPGLTLVDDSLPILLSRTCDTCHKYFDNLVCDYCLVHIGMCEDCSNHACLEMKESISDAKIQEELEKLQSFTHAE